MDVFVDAQDLALTQRLVDCKCAYIYLTDANRRNSKKFLSQQASLVSMKMPMLLPGKRR